MLVAILQGVQDRALGLAVGLALPGAQPKGWDARARVQLVVLGDAAGANIMSEMSVLEEEARRG